MPKTAGIDSSNPLLSAGEATIDGQKINVCSMEVQWLRIVFFRQDRHGFEKEKGHFSTG